MQDMDHFETNGQTQQDLEKDVQKDMSKRYN